MHHALHVLDAPRFIHYVYSGEIFSVSGRLFYRMRIKHVQCSRFVEYTWNAESSVERMHLT